MYLRRVKSFLTAPCDGQDCVLILNEVRYTGKSEMQICRVPSAQKNIQTHLVWGKYAGKNN